MRGMESVSSRVRDIPIYPAHPVCVEWSRCRPGLEISLYTLHTLYAWNGVGVVTDSILLWKKVLVNPRLPRLHVIMSPAAIEVSTAAPAVG